MSDQARSQEVIVGWRIILLILLAMDFVLIPGCTKKSTAQTSTADLHLDLRTPFRFVAYGNTRFHDPADSGPANPAVRTALVHAIADVNPAFICFTGDIVYNGYDVKDPNWLRTTRQRHSGCAALADPARLQLEITETVAAADPNLTSTVLSHLKHMGIGVILDDFAIGTSSLCGLRQFPVDALNRPIADSQDALGPHRR